MKDVIKNDEIRQEIVNENVSAETFDTSQQANLLLILSEFINPENERKRIRTIPFKVLNSIYLFTKNCQIKKYPEVFPSYDLLAKMSYCSRKEVAEFIESNEIEIFCEVKREPFKSNRYYLKQWVFEWFKLFYRFGMMKNLHSNFKKWLSSFKKRMKNFIMPWIEKGFNISQILIELLNKLSTKLNLKGDAVKTLKGDAIKSFTGIKTYVYKTIFEKPPDKPKTDEFDPILTDFKKICSVLRDRFNIGISDINQFIKKNSAFRLNFAINLLEKQYQTGWRANSPIKALQNLLNKFSPSKKAS